MICEACKKHVYFLEKCNYCFRLVCNSCIKSRKIVDKKSRYIICKQCWSNMPARKEYKSL